MHSSSRISFSLLFLVLPFNQLPSRTALGQQPKVGATITSSGSLESLRSGKLTVWESGRSSFLNWDAIRSALAEDFPQLQIDFRLLPAQEFSGTLSDARAAGAPPDVVFVDNWGQGAPLIAHEPVMEMAGRSRFTPSRGWWFLMRGGAHEAAAADFLHWLEDAPDWRPPHLSSAGLTTVDRSEVESISRDAVSSLTKGNSSGPEMDSNAAGFSTLNWGTDCGRIAEMGHPALRFVFGNGRVAYAAVSSDAKSSGGRVVCSGVMQLFLVLRKRADGWKVLLLMPSVSLDQAVSVADNFDRLGLLAGPGDAVVAPRLLSPADGEPQTRFPKQEIAWQQSAKPPASYVVESEAGLNENGEVEFGSSILDFIDPAQYGDVVRIPTPFGVGMQPHRWRVWAVGRDGEIALSEWRRIDFTN